MARSPFLSNFSVELCTLFDRSDFMASVSPLKASLAASRSSVGVTGMTRTETVL